MEARVLHDSSGAGTPVVYVPGIDGTGELLLGTARRLEAGFRLIRLRYETETSERSAEGELAALSSSVREAIESTGAAGVLVLAESFGVSVALQLALDRPELVRGLALVNGFAFFEGKVRLWLGASLGRLLPDPLFQLGRRLFAAHLFGPRRDAQALRDFRAVTTSRFDAGYRHRLGMIRRVDLRDRIGSIQKPVALFAADSDHVVDSVAEARRMQAALHDATVEVVPDSGHLILPLADEPWLERMEALARRAGC